MQHGGLSQLLFAAVFMWVLRLGGALAATSDKFSLVAPFYATLIGELLVGTCFGPHGIDAIPHVEAVRLIGEIALCVLVFEGGIAVDLKRIRSIGCKAIAIALTGTLLPLLIGWGLLILLGYGTKEGLAAGTALSSTSIGMTTRLLQDNSSLESREGVLITVAAIVDDIASLVILATLGSLSGDNPNVWTFARPLVASVVVTSLIPFFLWSFPRAIFYGEATIRWFSGHIETSRNVHIRDIDSAQPKVESNLDQIQQSLMDSEKEINDGPLKTGAKTGELELEQGSKSVSSKREAKDFANQDEDAILGLPLESEEADPTEEADYNRNSTEETVALVRVLLVAGFLIGMVAATGFAGTTPLLGAFITGISSSKVPRLRSDWEEKVGTISAALTSVFFASIGTYVPLRQMFHPKALGLGLLYTAAAVMGKWITGLIAWNEGGWVTVNVVGWAMVGRGELGFMMAASALKMGLLSKESFSITVWALLLATVLSPILFRRCTVLPCSYLCTSRHK